MGKQKSALRENVEAVAIAVVLALFIRTFVVQAFKIPSGSMKNTLLIGDHILVNKFIYGINLPFFEDPVLPLGEPKVGDIVVFIYPKDTKKDFIKRVVGVGGDEIRIHNKKIIRNGVPVMDEPYARFTDPRIMPALIGPRDNLDTFKVPPGHLFVMGDNRDESSDGRFWGFVNVRNVKGKAFMIYWSWDHDRMRPRLGRMGDFLH